MWIFHGIYYAYLELRWVNGTQIYDYFTVFIWNIISSILSFSFGTVIFFAHSLSCACQILGTIFDIKIPSHQNQSSHHKDKIVSQSLWWEWLCTLQWHHNGHDGVSNHRPHHCLLNHLFRCRSKKTSKLHVTGLCVGNSLVTGEFPTQMASNAENASIWWRHHGCNLGVISI